MFFFNYSKLHTQNPTNHNHEEINPLKVFIKPADEKLKNQQIIYLILLTSMKLWSEPNIIWKFHEKSQKNKTIRSFLSGVLQKYLSELALFQWRFGCCWEHVSRLKIKKVRKPWKIPEYTTYFCCLLLVVMMVVFCLEILY